MRVSAAAERRILFGLAAFAMVWVIVRAHGQAITIDEAVTSVNFVLPEFPTYWTPHANNHVLNSMLMRFFTRLFGPSNLTIRSGALIGAAIYILACYFLTTLIRENFLLRTAVFVCLVFNPFIFDFLVAARGYGLASGFLLTAICLVAYAKKRESPVLPCTLASICIVLSFLSNFSFAFVDAATIGLLYLWASSGTSLRKRAELAAASFLPILLAAIVIAPMLLQWKEPLDYGSSSLAETLKSLYEPSFYELSPAVSDLIFVDVPGVILPLFVLFAVWRVGLIWKNRRSLDRWSSTLAVVPIIAVAAAISAQLALFHLKGLLLPKDRTGIYIVVLTTLFLGMLAAVPIPTRAGEISRRGLTVLMLIMGSYFLLCLRVSHFKQWKFNADIDKVYAVLASYNHACGLKDIAVNWRYDGALNYYRIASGRETFPRFPFSGEYPAGKRAYVIFRPEDDDFLTRHNFTIVYRGQNGAAIALDPAVEPPPGESPCALTLPDPRAGR